MLLPRLYHFEECPIICSGQLVRVDDHIEVRAKACRRWRDAVNHYRLPVGRTQAGAILQAVIQRRRRPTHFKELIARLRREQLDCGIVTGVRLPDRCVHDAVVGDEVIVEITRAQTGDLKVRDADVILSAANVASLHTEVELDVGSVGAAVAESGGGVGE